jgi:hypothetical protein
LNLKEIEAEKLWQILKSYRLISEEIRIYQDLYDKIQDKIEAVQTPSAVRYDTEKVSGTPTPKDTIVNVLYSDQQDVEKPLNIARAQKAAIEELCAMCSEETQAYIEDKFFRGIRWFEMEERYHYTAGAIRKRIFSELEYIVAINGFDYEKACRRHLKAILQGDKFLY